MVNTCKSHFESLYSKFGEIITLSFKSGVSGKLSDLFQFVEDLNTWHEILADRVDTTLFLSALREYELGFQAAVCGQYRYAFGAHRYFLEQICRFIYLSSNELYLRHWKIGLRDVPWSALTDKEEGILSKNYIRAFYPEVDSEGEHILSLVSTLYREYSEYVHGNFSKIKIMPTQIDFNEELLTAWLEFATTSKFAASFLLFMRFSKEIKTTELQSIEALAKEELGSIKEFNLLFV